MPPESLVPAPAAGEVCIDTIATRTPSVVMRPLYSRAGASVTAGSCYEWGMTPPHSLPLSQRLAMTVVSAASSRPLLVKIAGNRVVVRAGYVVATAFGLAWGAALSVGAIESQRGVIVARGCPKWAFGRGGTSIGAVYLTRDNVSEGVLDHEAVHREQWRRFGLAMIPLYLAAGPIAVSNRFEVEAGLERGGYR